MSEQQLIAGKYRIVREIARSNDVVYEARDESMGRRLAVKQLLLPANLTGQARRDRVERFHREARACGMLTHPNIVTTYNYGEDNGTYYIAMEYLEGQNLRDALTARGSLSIKEAADIACQMLSALAHAHLHKVIHRDIKPDNIHLLPGGIVKLTDFGIARLTEESSLTDVGQVFGTPSYMSPEQIRGATIDYRTDLFAVGVVLYEMIAGRKPFTGDSVISITYAIMESPPAPLTGVPYAMEQVIFKAIEKDPSRRYANAEEMRRALKAVDLNQSASLRGQTGMGAWPNAGSIAPAAGYPFGGGPAGSQYGAPHNNGYGNPGTGGLPQSAPYYGGQQSQPVYGQPPSVYTGGYPPTAYAPPPSMAPPAQVPMSGPFVTWGQPGAAPQQQPGMHMPPPFPHRSPGFELSDGAKTFLKAMMLAIILGAMALGGVLLFNRAFENQKLNGNLAVIDSRLTAAEELIASSELAKAREQLEELWPRARGGKLESRAREDLVAVYNRLGLHEYELKHFKEAEVWWLRANDIDPDNETINANLKALWNKMGSKDDTLREWAENRNNRAAGNPGDATMRSRLEEAKANLDKGIKLRSEGDPGNAKTYFNKAIQLGTGTDIAARATKELAEINSTQTDSSEFFGGR